MQPPYGQLVLLIHIIQTAAQRRNEFSKFVQLRFKQNLPNDSSSTTLDTGICLPSLLAARVSLGNISLPEPRHRMTCITTASFGVIQSVAWLVQAWPSVKAPWTALAFERSVMP